MATGALSGEHFPGRRFRVGVAVICVSLLLSALHGFHTLSRLREEYLLSRCLDIAAALDTVTRPPGRRHSPRAWQAAFDEAMHSHVDTVVFLALVGPGRELLAGVGDSGAAAYFFEKDLAIGPDTRWLLWIGLDPGVASFITRQAWMQVVVTTVAALALAGVALYLFQTLAQYLALRRREESQRGLAALGRMSAVLAHEIRNPLGAMKGLTQVSREQLAGDHRAGALLDTVVGEAGRLERLVDNLLSFARVEREARQRVDVRQLVLDVRDLLRARLDDAGCELSVTTAEPIPEFESDRDGLRQVLLNVIDNALRASPHGQTVEVHIGRDATSPRVVIDVRDRGVGLGGEDPAGLFEAFITTRSSGVGLGLAVSRQILERLGGSIELRERVGGGARCTLSIPLTAVAVSVQP